MINIVNIRDLLAGYYSFFSKFKQAYYEDTIPHNAELPYITYSVSLEPTYGDTLIQARIWYRTTVLGDIANDIQKLEDYIGEGVLEPIGSGNNSLWIKKGSPFFDIQTDEDITIKVVYLNLITNVI